MFRIPIGALNERRVRAALTITMVMVGAALVTSLNGMTAGFNKFLDNQLSALSGNVLIVTPSQALTISQMAKSFGSSQQEQPKITLNEATVTNIRRIAGVNSAVPYIAGTAKVRGGGQEQTVPIMGLDQTKLASLWPKTTYESGSPLTSADSLGIVLGHDIAHPAGQAGPFATLHQSVTVEVSVTEVQGQTERVVTRSRSFQVKGIMDGGNAITDGRIFVSLPAANTLLQKGGVYSGIYVVTKDVDENDRVESEIRRVYGNNIGISSPRSISSSIHTVLSVFNTFVSSIAGVSVLVGGVGIITTLYTSVMERTKEIGLLKALGFSGREVLLVFLLESAIIGALGGTIGLIVGSMGAQFMAGSAPYGGGAFKFSAVLLPKDLALTWLLSVSVSCVAGLYPSWRASKMSPVVALRKE